MPVQQIPQSLWSGLFQPSQPNAVDPSLSTMMDLHQQRMDPRLFLREVNPGATWGGRDRNAMHPNDLMQMYFSAVPSENT